jgi:hypothetical protein
MEPLDALRDIDYWQTVVGTAAQRAICELRRKFTSQQVSVPPTLSMMAHKALRLGMIDTSKCLDLELLNQAWNTAKHTIVSPDYHLQIQCIELQKQLAQERQQKEALAKESAHYKEMYELQKKCIQSLSGSQSHGGRKRAATSEPGQSTTSSTDGTHAPPHKRLVRSM